MLKSFNGKVYDSEKMTTLCSRSAYNNGNYAGETKVSKTPSGLYCAVYTSNGQDLYRQAGMEPLEKKDIAAFISGWTLDDSETEALIAEGVLSEA